MKQEDYKRALKAWEKYECELEIYTEKKRDLVQRNAEDKEFIKLEEEFDLEDYFGPFTIIDDPRDLVNPNFILPGYGVSFMGLSNTDHHIPEYFGKILHSDMDGKEGVVVGYGYDAGDDYIRIQDKTGKIHNILVNSHYTVEGV